MVLKLRIAIELRSRSLDWVRLNLIWMFHSACRSALPSLPTSLSFSLGRIWQILEHPKSKSTQPRSETCWAPCKHNCNRRLWQGAGQRKLYVYWGSTSWIFFLLFHPVVLCTGVDGQLHSWGSNKRPLASEMMFPAAPSPTPLGGVGRVGCEWGSLFCVAVRIILFHKHDSWIFLQHQQE